MASKQQYQIALSLLYRNRLSTAHRLLAHYASAEEVFRHIDEPDIEKSLLRAEQEIEWMSKHGICCYFCKDANYPYRLQQCPDAPIVLFGKGNVRFDAPHIVSIVGTRRATERGVEQTKRFVSELQQLVPDATVVSGLAYGIDIAAHRAALEVGLPTIIVPGHGLDRIYPPLHRDVAVKALATGGLLTEYPSQTEPFAGNFVARDRIIAALSDATVVVESRQKGGALITADMAYNYDRSVFAFPGRNTDESSRGCNSIIREQKAALIESAEDFVEAMMWRSESAKKPIQTEMVELTESLDETERLLLSRLRENEEGMHINLLVIETSLSYSQVSSSLMMLELKDIVRALPGGIYRALK